MIVQEIIKMAPLHSSLLKKWVEGNSSCSFRFWLISYIVFGLYIGAREEIISTIIALRCWEMRFKRRGRKVLYPWFGVKLTMQ